MTTTTDYRVLLTLDEAIRLATEIVAEYPARTSPPVYYSDSARGAVPEDIIGHILKRAGFNAPLEWWAAQRHDGLGNYSTASKRLNTHVRFLTDELFANEDTWRDAFLRTLQTWQDKGHEWQRALKAANNYMRLLERNPSVLPNPNKN